MGINEKTRSLYAGMPGGGFQFKTDPVGQLYLPPESMPYELERIFVRWAEAQSEELKHTIIHLYNSKKIGISVLGWEIFVKWMLSVLETESYKLLDA